MADQNYLDISIDCLTGTDISLLNAQNLQFPTEVTYRDYSWQIRVPDKPNLHKTTLIMRTLGFSLSFRSLAHRHR